MLGGSISWETIGEPPSIDEVRGTANSAQSAANAAQSKADSAYNRADSAYSEATAAGNTASSTSAAITDLVNGRYDPDHDYAYSTFIQGNAIYSPELYFGENSNYGYLKVGTGSNGEEVTDLIVLHGDNGLRIEAQGGGLAIVASGGVWSGEGAVEGDDTIWHFGDVYALATHTDTISGRPGTGNNLHLSGTVYLDSYSSTRPLVEYEWLWRDRTNALKQALDSAGISVPQWPG